MARAPALHAGGHRFKSCTAQFVSIEAINVYTSERHFFRLLIRGEDQRDCSEMLNQASKVSETTSGTRRLFQSRARVFAEFGGFGQGGIAPNAQVRVRNV